MAGWGRVGGRRFKVRDTETARFYSQRLRASITYRKTCG